MTLPVEVEIPRGSNVLEFRETTGLADDAFLNSGARSTIRRNADRIAERAMWTSVSESVADSCSGIGRVFLESSQFSHQGDGVFTMTSRASNIRIQGGASALLGVVRANAVPAEPQVIEAVEQLAQQGKITGRLEGVFRVGGRVPIVAGLASDAYNTASGATNVAGPLAWTANALGSVVAAGVGYWVGSEAGEF